MAGNNRGLRDTMMIKLMALLYRGLACSIDGHVKSDIHFSCMGQGRFIRGRHRTGNFSGAKPVLVLPKS